MSLLLLFAGAGDGAPAPAQTIGGTVTTPDRTDRVITQASDTVITEDRNKVINKK